ncbi:MAG: alkaline phosphatase, partial [Frankiales bacterium]|nr:alkaline phosphatase [Frankiales bacterium]
LGEKLRQASDLEHWAAFGTSFARMTDLLASVGSGEQAPQTVVFLSGDVHFAYLAEAHFPHRPEVTSRLFQAVCSPIRNPLPTGIRYGQRAMSSRALRAAGRWLQRSAKVAPPELVWQVEGGPAFGNEIATLTLDGRSASLDVESAQSGPTLSRSFRHTLS